MNLHNQRRAEQRRQRAAAAEQLRADEADARRLILSARPVDGYRKLVAVLAQRHRITVVVTPAGRNGSALASSRTIMIPPIVDAGTFAVALHEIGHVINGTCPQRDPHRPLLVSGSLACVACEVAATRTAMQLAPFTPEMHAHLRYALKTYRWSTPAPAQALRALDRLASFTGYALARTAFVKRDVALERQRLAEISLAAQRARWGR